MYYMRQHASQEVKLWVYADADRTIGAVWKQIAQVVHAEQMYSVGNLSTLVGDDASQKYGKLFASWSRSKGWICHSRLTFRVQEDPGALGVFWAVFVALRINPEGSTTSSITVSASDANSNMFDGQHAERVRRAVELASLTMTHALSSEQIQHKFM